MCVCVYIYIYIPTWACKRTSGHGHLGHANTHTKCGVKGNTSFSSSSVRLTFPNEGGASFQEVTLRKE